MRKLIIAVALAAFFFPHWAHAVSLTGYYKLDDASLSTAAATVGVAGTYNSGFAVADLGQAGSLGDPSGNSVNFPTTGNQKITIPSGGGITDGSTFSITAWVQLASGTLATSKDHTLASNAAAFGGSANLLFWRDGDTSTTENQTLAAIVAGDPPGRINGANGALNDTSWHLVALTFNNAGADGQVYVDGVNISSTLTGNATGALNTALAITLGNVGTDVASQQLQGNLDEVAFWNRELNAPEMDALFFLSAGEGDFVADAAGAASLFDFYENGSVGDSFLLNDSLGFLIVGDVTALGGTAGQSVDAGGQLLLGLDPNGPGGLASFATPEPGSIAVWALLGAVGVGIAFRRRRTR